MGTVNDDILVERITPKILSAIRSKSKPVESLSVKADLTGITSLPAYDTTGGQYKKVLVGMEALRKPATDAASIAGSAADKANAAADKANATNALVTENEQGRVEAEQGRVDAEQSRVSAEEDRVYNESARVEEFTRLAQESAAATASANDTADHPTYIGNDNYVYRWNKEMQTYDKTDIYVRGEAFSIKKVYSSIDEMLSDTVNVFKEGDFCLIDTGDVENPDNAKLYVRSEVGSWDFLVDMSGAIGFTGKTPQIFVGDVTVGSGRNSVAVTLSPDGVDTDGNPKYRYNFIIPCLAYEDLTAEQIAELQKPATDVLEQMIATRDELNDNEDARKAAEQERVDAESVRISSEDTRKENENARISGENGRVANELIRTEAEDIRVESENTRESNEDTRKSNEETRLSNEESRVSVEAARVESENTRESNENTRKSNEETRLANEESRVTVEAARVESENTRKSNEDARIADEETRKTNEEVRVETEILREEAENVRKANEEVRIENESIRISSEEAREQVKDEMIALNQELKEHPPVINEEDYWEVWDAVNKQYVNTNIIARGKRPVIRDGIWWLWDDDIKDYTSTGWAVNSDFQLTKGGIEGVFTGDIDSHTHSHLIYYAQVYDEVPDFDTLTTWTGANGIVHDFVPGNDIYVKNESEPTGYANYKLAVTTEGNMWVRIPQVAAGWRIVMVKE